MVICSAAKIVLFASRSRGHLPNRFDTTVERAVKAVNLRERFSAIFRRSFDYGPCITT